MRSEGYVSEENARSATISSPLARRHGEASYLELLLKHSLWLAYKPDKTEIADLLERFRAKPGCSDDFEQQALFRTMYHLSHAFVEVLLDNARVDPNLADKDGYPLLHKAVLRGTSTLVRVLLSHKKVNPNCAARDGFSPLHTAVRQGDDRIVRLLLENDRVDTNVTDEGGRTPLHLATYWEKESVIKVLLHDSRVDVIYKDKEGHTPLFYAFGRKPRPKSHCTWSTMEKNRVPVIKMLLSAIRKDAAFVEKELVFRRATQQGNEEVVRVLLDDGRFDPNSRDIFGLTPLSWVKAQENQSIAKMLDNSATEDIAQSDPRLEIAGRCLGFWVNACDKKHAGSCCAKPVVQRLPHEIPAWVIDVSRGCIVPGQQASRYVALSYVWDTRQYLMLDERDEHLEWDYRLLLKRGNLSDFRTPGYLQGAIANRLPAVIRDTMALVNHIGEKYLWIDCLCIVQDDDRIREQIDHMHEVYMGAYLTIIAATHCGLLSKPKVPGENFDQMHFPRWDSHWHHWSTKYRIQELHRRLLRSKWASRGWTLQEQIMSKRAVVFLDGDIFWDCQLAVSDQDQLFPDKMEEQSLAPHYGTAHKVFKTSWPDFRTYLELIGLYNKRDFSYPQDSLPAISGLLKLLTQSFPYGFIGGLPRLMLHEALLWQPFSQVTKSRVRSGCYAVCVVG